MLGTHGLCLLSIQREGKVNRDTDDSCTVSLTRNLLERRSHRWDRMGAQEEGSPLTLGLREAFLEEGMPRGILTNRYEFTRRK